MDNKTILALVNEEAKEIRAVREEIKKTLAIRIIKEPDSAYEIDFLRRRL